MTRVIDYSAPGDHRTVVQAALDAIREPQLVGLPSESGYLLATSSVNAEGVSRLINLAQTVNRPLSLCLAEAGQIEDYLDRVPPQAMRLAQRSWPGPVAGGSGTSVTVNWPSMNCAAFMRVLLRC